MEYVQNPFFHFCVFVRNLSRLLTSLLLLSHTQRNNSCSMYTGTILHFKGVFNRSNTLKKQRKHRLRGSFDSLFCIKAALIYITFNNHNICTKPPNSVCVNRQRSKCHLQELCILNQQV